MEYLSKMNIWLLVGEVIGAIFTIIILYLLIKEMRKVVKESNDGKVSNRCELD